MKTKGKIILIIVVALLLLAVATGAIFSHFGGFGTGKCADTEEFSKYVGIVSDITVPEQTRIIALGEATHGNAEFQQLKLDVFKVMVEKHGVRAFALEGDYGGCEAVNRYIHGGKGTAREAAAAIGFTLYSTDQMAQLIAWMREYNENAKENEDLQFYGFDMQRMNWNYYYLVEAAEKWGIDASALKQQWDDEKGTVSDAYTTEQWVSALESLKHELEQHEGTVAAVHHADILLQNCELGKVMAEVDKGVAARDAYMADNVRWILEQEEARGNMCIFVSAHNGHIERRHDYGAAGKNMGNLLADEFEDTYFAIGTDFYKTSCNLPLNPSRTKRGNRTFYSHDPLAKASKKCGYEISWLDFSKIPASSPLKQQTTDYTWMGTVGDGYSPLMAFLPMTYRVWDSPAMLYDGMIFVSNAHPTAPYDL
ncbi:MAG: erythromycin esterase family protein [Bacteroidales bacterium]|nr:erythromycin esterase family protein [Bacteroidales bacterium]